MILIDEERLRWQLSIGGAVLVAIKLTFWAVIALNATAPSGFKQSRVPEANIEWLVPAPPQVDVMVLPAINDGLREKVHAWSTAEGATWGVVSEFMENLRHPVEVREVWAMFPDMQFQTNARCAVGVGAEDAVEALMVKHHGRQWVAYVRYPKGDVDDARASARQRHRFFRNVLVYDDDGRQWPLLSDADIERCVEARAMMMASAMRRQ